MPFRFPRVRSRPVIRRYRHIRERRRRTQLSQTIKALRERFRPKGQAPKRWQLWFGIGTAAFGVVLVITAVALARRDLSVAANPPVPRFVPEPEEPLNQRICQFLNALNPDLLPALEAEKHKPNPRKVEFNGNLHEYEYHRLQAFLERPGGKDFIEMDGESTRQTVRIGEQTVPMWSARFTLNPRLLEK